MTTQSLHADSELPGPRGWPVVGCLPALYRDPLGFVDHCAETYGDVTRIEIVGLSYYQLTRPEHIRYVLTNYKQFRKGSVGRERRRLFGRGLATAEGDFWLRQRHLSQPAFSRDRLRVYGQSMATLVQQKLPDWPCEQDIDLHPLLMRLTLDSVCKVLFGTDVDEDAGQVAESLEYAMDFFGSQASFVYHLLPRWFMTPGRRRFHREVDELDAIIGGIIRERRHSGSDAGDLLSMLLRARDDDDQAMDDRQLRDELMTLFLAGHETTALALTWSIGLLLENPAAMRAIEGEVAQVLAGRAPDIDDLDNLPYTAAVLKEAMRIYPPAWILARQANDDVDIGGVTIPRGAFVTLPQWVTHRDARYFEQPMAFKPERWTAEFEKSLPKHVYFPFGAGPRGCIGRALSLMEATLYLAALVQRFEIVAGPAFKLQPSASLSLRPAQGIQVRLRERRSHQVAAA